ncbi:hypothetical protein CYLTODRAFT_489119 [Cylindrobasidium torrendii FP15055 ss-10]|uniref:Uncharacterized protein n=1 Tax=Cylindrobasidium torrendii FP15055 ss-10 TaxID=1314674 RepID=A0A0D7BGB2_9AGAR|nr:hypothetical protein CYLTODRAFT_489119 [Cylindrobasidium torrendii FP15055 ss-10]
MSSRPAPQPRRPSFAPIAFATQQSAAPKPPPHRRQSAPTSPRPHVSRPIPRHVSVSTPSGAGSRSVSFAQPPSRAYRYNNPLETTPLLIGSGKSNKGGNGGKNLNGGRRAEVNDSVAAVGYKILAFIALATAMVVVLGGSVYWNMLEDRSALLTSRERAVAAVELRLQRDAELRAKTRIYWSQTVRGEQCIGQDTRVYTAELLGLPPSVGVPEEDVDRIGWCQSLNQTITGTTYAKPEACKLDDEKGRVYGVWTVANDPDCHTYWVEARDLGCRGVSGNMRYYEARLENHQGPRRNWREMCKTTLWPGKGAPDVCREKANNTYGGWLVDDDSCMGFLQ